LSTLLRQELARQRRHQALQHQRQPAPQHQVARPPAASTAPGCRRFARLTQRRGPSPLRACR
jgi:hypothetical protein